MKNEKKTITINRKEPIMAFQKKRTQVFGKRFATRTLAIQNLLSKGMRKCDIAKKMNAHYSFIVTVSKKMEKVAAAQTSNNALVETVVV